MARTGSQLGGSPDALLRAAAAARSVVAAVAVVAVVFALAFGGVATASGATRSLAAETPAPAEFFGSGSRRLLIVAGIHGDEYGGPLAARFAAYLRKHPSAIPTGTCIDVIAYANPDGRALKRRTNAHKVDLNRNFPASNWTRWHAPGTSSHGRRPASEPETRAIMWQLKRGHYTRVLALHSRGGVVDYNGKGGHKLAHRVAKAAHIRVLRLPKFPGSMCSYVPERFHDPVITWELSSRKLTKRVRAGLMAWVR